MESQQITPSLDGGIRVNLQMPEIDMEQLGQIAPTIGGAISNTEQQQPQEAEQPVEFSKEEVVEDKPIEVGDPAWLDIAKSPFRGMLAAGQSVIELMDTITGDTLPDIDIRVLGRSNTDAGKVIEGISQFVTGFAVSGGIVGGVAKGIGGLVAGAKGAQAAAGLIANPIVGGAIKGAVTDFSFMDANQERLSNLIEAVPQLQNPISAYLASDKEEGDIEGRLKNALEGTIVGVALDATVHMIGAGVKAIKKANKLRVEGVEPQKVADIVAADMKKAEETMPHVKEATQEDVSTPVVKTDNGSVVIEKKVGETVESTTLATKEEVDELAVEAIDELAGRKLSGADSAIKKLTSKILQTAKNEADSVSFQKSVMEAVSKRIDEMNPSSVFDGAELVRRRIKNTLAKGGGELISVEEAKGAFKVGDFPSRAAMVRRQSEGYGIIAQSKAKELYEKIKGGADITDEEQKEFADILFRSYEWSGINKKYKQSAGRGLFQYKNLEKFSKQSQEVVDLGLGQESQATKDIELFKNNFNQIMKEEPAQAKKLLSKQIEAFAMADDVNDVLDNATKAISTGGRIMDTSLEYFINSLLSPKSCIVNSLSSTIQATIRPFEFWAGTMYKGEAEKKYMARAYTQMFADLGQSWNYFVKSLKEEKGTFGATQIEASNDAKAISAKYWNIDSQAHPGRAAIIDGLGRMIRLPGNIMQATDSAFKFLGMRSAAAGKFAYDAYKKGLSGLAADQYVAKNLENYFNESGLINSQSSAYMAAAKEAREKGLKGIDSYNYINNRSKALFDANRDSVGKFVKSEAGEITNTRDFGDDPGMFGQLSNGLAAFAKQFPAVKFFIPFIKTPAQLLRYVSEHTPITGQMAALNKSAVAEMASSDTLIRAGAIGRLHTGTMLWSMAGALALSGRITGYGPQDPRERKALMATGWKPYSIRIGDTYHQYNRLDPIASFFGIAADVGDQVKTGVEQDDAFHSIAFQSAWLPLQQNFTNKTFMRGFADVIDLMSASDEDGLQRVLLNKVGALIPSTIANMASGLGNDFSVGASTQPGDYLLRRIPGLTGLVDRNRNVLGEAIDVTPMAGRNILDPINPFTMGKNRGDKVINELARLKHPFSPPRKKLGGIVDLTNYTNKSGQTAYDRYCELVSTTRIGNNTIRNEISKLISSPRYKAMNDIYLDGYSSPKVAAINRVIEKYRAGAREQLLKEFPEVSRAWKKRNDIQQSLKQNKYAGLI